MVKKPPPKAQQNRLKHAFRGLKRASSGKVDRAAKREYNSIIPSLLARCERAYVKLHVEEALDEAVRIGCRQGPVQPWMREPLIERARAAILGTLKEKPGRRSDWT